MIDLARAGAPAVLVPFEQGREAEQRLRAECFARQASRASLRRRSFPAQVSPWRSRRRSPGRNGRPSASTSTELRGAVRAIDRFCARCLDVEAAWAAVDEALDIVEANHGGIDVWWRDDDAMAPTPALDRLLALSARLDIPVALAVVPSGAGAALCERIAGEPLADVLVHGFAHRNHAPVGAKKQELGFRDPDVIAAELSAGLRKLDG